MSDIEDLDDAPKPNAKLLRAAKRYRDIKKSEQINDDLKATELKYKINIPEGWKLVPIKPTQEWIENLKRSGYVQSYEGVIRGVISAAPLPPLKDL